MISIGAVVGREAREHFKDEYAERVPVYAFVVAILDHDLGLVMSWQLSMSI